MEYTRNDQQKTRYAIYDFIVWYKETYNGNSPSIREIKKAAELGSTSTVHHHIEELIKEKLLYTHDDIDSGTSRCLMVTGGKWRQDN